MKETTLGIWEIGNERVELAVRSGYGAEYYYRPEARIVVGIDHSEWSSVIGCLLHEAFEFVLDRSNARYDATNNHANDNGSYLFVMTHALFSDACEKSSSFITGCMQSVRESWQANHNPRKKKAAKCQRRK